MNYWYPSPAPSPYLAGSISPRYMSTVDPATATAGMSSLYGMNMYGMGGSLFMDAVPGSFGGPGSALGSQVGFGSQVGGMGSVGGGGAGSAPSLYVMPMQGAGGGYLSPGGVVGMGSLYGSVGPFGPTVMPAFPLYSSGGGGGGGGSLYGGSFYGGGSLGSSGAEASAGGGGAYGHSVINETARRTSFLAKNNLIRAEVRPLRSHRKRSGGEPTPPTMASSSSASAPTQTQPQPAMAGGKRGGDNGYDSNTVGQNGSDRLYSNGSGSGSGDHTSDAEGHYKSNSNNNNSSSKNNRNASSSRERTDGAGPAVGSGLARDRRASSSPASQAASRPPNEQQPQQQQQQQLSTSPFSPQQQQQRASLAQSAVRPTFVEDDDQAPTPEGTHIRSLAVLARTGRSPVVVRRGPLALAAAGTDYALDEVMSASDAGCDGASSVVLSELRCHWVMGHHTGLLLGAGAGLRDASVRLARGFLASCTAKLDEIGSEYCIYVSAVALRGSTEGRDLFAGPYAPYSRLQTASSPLYGPALGGLVRRRADTEAQLLRALDEAVALSTELEELISTHWVLVQTKRPRTSDRAVYISSLHLTLAGEGLEHLVGLRHKSASEPAWLYRYTIGGASVTACAVVLADDDARSAAEAAGVLTEMAAVRNGEPRSGNVRRFVEYTRNEIRVKGEAITDPGKRRLHEAMVARMEVMLRDAEEIYENPASVEPKAYAPQK